MFHDDGLAGEAAVEWQADHGLVEVAVRVGVLAVVGVAGFDAADTGEERPVHVAVGLLDGEDPLGVLVGGDAHARDSECSLGHGRGERGSGLHGSQRRGFRRGGGSRLGDCFDGGQNLRLRFLRGLCGGVHRFGRSWC